MAPRWRRRDPRARDLRSVRGRALPRIGADHRRARRRTTSHSNATATVSAMPIASPIGTADAVPKAPTTGAAMLANTEVDRPEERRRGARLRPMRGERRHLDARETEARAARGRRTCTRGPARARPRSDATSAAVKPATAMIGSEIARIFGGAKRRMSRDATWEGDREAERVDGKRDAVLLRVEAVDLLEDERRGRQVGEEAREHEARDELDPDEHAVGEHGRAADRPCWPLSAAAPGKRLGDDEARRAR